MFHRLIWLCLCTALLAPAQAQPLAPLRVVTTETPGKDPCALPQFVIFKQAMDRLQRSYVCEAMPWARAQRMVEEGQRDAMITYPSAARLLYSQASLEPVIQVEQRLFTSRHHPQRKLLDQVRELADLKPWLAVTYLGDGWSTQHLQPLNIKIHHTKTLDHAFRMLALGRADFTIESDIYARADLQRLGLRDDVVMLSPVFGQVAYHLLINKDSPHLELLPLLDASLVAMKNDGTLDKIYAQWR